MNRKFKVDFFEFCFLVEACIPPQPIARSMFWDDVINHYYHQMTPNERSRLFTWIKMNDNFDPEKEVRCKIFENRFDPANQYMVFTEKGGNKESKEAFMMDGKYYIAKDTWIDPEYITKIKKINE